MELLYKDNLIKINNKINKLKNKKLKCEKRVRFCEKLFNFFAFGHIIVAGIYDIPIVISAMFDKVLPPIITPFMIGIISSCLFSLSITSIVQLRNDKNTDKIEELIKSFENVRTEYMKKATEKFISFEDRCKNIRSKNIVYANDMNNQFVDACDFEFEKDHSLCLRK